MSKILIAAVTLCAVALTGSALAQAKNNVPDIVPGARPVPVEHIKVHGPSLEGNLEGDAVDRDALVFLPPGYAADKARRYPVVYALHGYSIGAEQWEPGNPCSPDHRGCLRQGCQGDDRGASRFQDRA